MCILCIYASILAHTNWSWNNFRSSFALIVLASLKAILLSFICILPLAVYPLDNGVVPKAFVPAYTGPLLEFLVALLLFIHILLLNVNSASPITSSPIVRRQYGYARARSCVCSLCAAAARRGPAVLLFVQSLSLVAYTFTISATASQRGTERGGTAGPLIRNVVLRFIGDVLFLLWITGWVVLFYCASHSFPC